MTRRIITARTQVEMLSPWYRHAGVATPPPHTNLEDLVGHKRIARQDPDLRWERGFDGGGGWELIIRNPDGNPVRVKTEPARGQRSAKRRNHDR